MKKCSFAITLMLLICNYSLAQMFEVEPLVSNGDIEKYINIVVLGDGYTASEQEKFVADAQDFSDYLFTQEPYKNYKDFFNVFAIKVPSNESGADHPGDATDVTEPAFAVQEVDNYFGSTFDGFGIHRLLIVENTSAIFNVLASNFPLYDQVIVLVNSPHYGGSGGTFAVSSLNASANEIAVHEIGHSFVGLIDEYYAGDIYSAEGINMTAETDPEMVRWKNWMGYKQVGIYQHCCSGQSANWYRPHENCKMRFLGPEFCPVCKEGTIEQIHFLVPLLNEMEPLETTLEFVGEPLRFSLDLKKPEPNTVDVQWVLNEDTIAAQVDSLLLNPDLLEPGLNELVATIEDQSPFVRIDGHANIHSELAIWQVNLTSSGIIDLEGSRHVIDVKITPNPVEDDFVVTLEREINFNLEVEIYNLEGQKMAALDLQENRGLRVEATLWPAGTYVLHFRKGTKILSSRKIVKL